MSIHSSVSLCLCIYAEVCITFCKMCRCGAVFVTQPLDLIKNRMQLSGK